MRVAFRVVVELFGFRECLLDLDPLDDPAVKSDRAAGPLAPGRTVDENWLALRSVGFFNLSGLISLIPVGLRMMIRGKLPPLIPHSIEKVDEVKKIFARFEELRK